jgi:hypothetical protein
MSKRKIKVVPLEQTIEAPQVESIVDPAPKEDTPHVEDPRPVEDTPPVEDTKPTS